MTNTLAFDNAVEGPEKSYRVTAIGPGGESDPSATVVTHDNELRPYFSYWPPSLWDGTLTATSAVVNWVSSLVDGTDGMLELGTNLQPFTVIHFDPNYGYWFSVTLSNLLPQTTYYLRISGVGPNRAGSSAVVMLSTPEVNDPPAAPDLTWPPVTYAGSIAVPLQVSDPDGSIHPLELSIVTFPTNGSLSDIYFLWNGTTQYYVDYTPNPGARGPDSFQWQAADGSLLSRVATVSFPDIFLNNRPQAVNLVTNTTEDTPLTFTLSATDADGDPLSYSFYGASGGDFSGTPPQVVFTPSPNFSGDVLAYYQVSDGYDHEFLEVQITVTAVNDAPVANAGSAVAAEDGSVAVLLTGADVESTALTYAVVTGPIHGTLTGTAPNLVYTPAANYAGEDTFVFQVSDGELTSAPAQVTVTVTAVNDAPVANAGGVATAYNTAVTFALTGSDVEGSALSYTVVQAPAGGALTGAAPSLTFSPNPGFVGVATLTFRVNDGLLDSDTVTFSITVAAPTSTPPAPTGLTATAVSRSQINLTWTSNTSLENGFRIERSANGTSWTQIGTVGQNVTTYSSTGLSANKLYYYRVRAFNTLGNSPYSNVTSARTFR